MDYLSLIFGITTLISFFFSVFVYFKSESKKVAEAANNAMYLERVKNSRNAIIGILHTVDAIVQIPKRNEVSSEQLQDLARISRGQLYLLAEQLKIEKEQLKDWRFGHLVPSIEIEESLDKIDKNSAQHSI